MSPSPDDGPLEATAFLVEPARYGLRGVCAVVGKDPYLKQEVVTAICEQTAGDDDEFSVTRRDGTLVEWPDIADELATRSLFGAAQRIVVLEQTDQFLAGGTDRGRRDTRRAALEEYVSRPSALGLLVLVFEQLPAHTRLAKAIIRDGLLIKCDAPRRAAAVKFLMHRAQANHATKLDRAAAELILELMSSDLGQAEQELAKLAILSDNGAQIGAALVQQHVGDWRVRTAWEMIDAAADGEAQQALIYLDRLLTAGEQPIALLAQMSSTLRRFASATRIVERGERSGERPSLAAAVATAGFPPFKLRDAQRQLQQLGRQRGAQLYEWLLAADLALKGSHSAEPRARLVLEELIVKLSRQADPRRRAS